MLVERLHLVNTVKGTVNEHDLKIQKHTCKNAVKKIYGSHQFPKNFNPTAVALGVFDGVHLGHQELFKRARAAAKKINGVAVVYTFEPHPVRALSPSECPPLITTLAQKIDLIEKTGVDAVVIEKFTHELAQMEPADFFSKILLKNLHAKVVVAGHDFTFGRHRQGTMEILETLCAKQNLEAIAVPAVFADETLISSTIIRQMILHGNVGHAQKLLGRPYSIDGKVVAGKGLGGNLGAHTANIKTDNEIIPSNGVYISRTILENGKIYPSVTSIGDNPTFKDAKFSIETHLLNESCDLSGQEITIEFLSFMRGQIRFESEEKLREQIKKDIETARKFHGLT